MYCVALQEKNGGCLHMTCTQCRHEWWWCCGNVRTRLHIAALVSTVAHPLYYVQDYRKGHAKLCRHSGMTHFA